MRAMKDSGIEWIGEIPQEWDVRRLKHAILGIADGTHGTYSRTTDGYPLLSAKNVLDNGLHISNDESLISEKDYHEITACGYPQKGDILLCCVGTIGRTALYELDYPHAFQRSVIFIRCSKSASNKFLFYTLQSSYILAQEKQLVNKSAQEGIYQGAVRELNIAFPPIEEQHIISNYLDAKCAEIDALIAAKEKTNALLKEQRQSIIYEAVTKGLDPTVPMKDSGIEWIGTIPEGWDVHKIKIDFSIVAGATPKSGNSDFWDGDIAWITPADYATEDVYISCGHKKITQEGLDSCATSIIPENSIIFSKRAPVGLVAINTVPLCTNQGCLSCVPKAADNTKFYYYAMSVFTEQFDLFASGTTFKEISADAFANFKLPHPSSDIQNVIVDYLDSKCSEIDSIITANNETIKKLKEYRQSVIYEAVTGKIEVGNAVY